MKHFAFNLVGAMLGTALIPICHLSQILFDDVEDPLSPSLMNLDGYWYA